MRWIDRQPNVVKTQHIDSSRNLHSTKRLKHKTVSCDIETNKGGLINDLGLMIQQFNILESYNDSFCLFGVSRQLGMIWKDPLKQLTE